MDFKDLSAEMRKALTNFPQLEGALRKSGDLIKQFAGYQEDYNKKLKESETILESTVSHLNKMKDILPGATQAYKDHAKAMGATAEQFRLANMIANDLTDEANKAVALTVMQKTGLTGIYAQSVAQMLIERDITDEKKIQEEINGGSLDDALKLQKANQDAFNQLKKQNDLTQDIADQMVAIRDEADSYKKKLDGVLATARAIGNDPKVMGAFMLTQGIKALGKFTEGFKEFQKQGLSSGQAIEAQFKGMDLMSMMGLSDAKGVTSAMIEQFGNVNALSRDTTQQLGRMAVEFGISGQEAGALNAAMSTIPGETSESAANAMEMTGHLAKMQGIAPGKIMKDMAKNTDEMARAGAKGAEEFGKSIVNLHKMGIEMSTVSKVADGLLDFESSINAQMEASVLLGREINLDKARELALMNDMDGLAKEIANTVGGSAEFAKMNRLEQDALAKSVGLTLPELTKMMDAQEESNKLSGEGSGRMADIAGTMTKVGSATGGFLKENGLLIMSTIQFLQAQNLTKLKGYATDAAHWIKEKAHMAYLKTAAALGSKGAAGKLAEKMGGGASDKTKVPDIKTDAIDKAGKVKGPGGFKKAMQEMAGGLKALGNAKVLFGIVNLALFAPAAVIAVAGIPFLALVASAGVFIGKGLKALAGGLKAMANPKVVIGVGILSILALALGASILMMGIGIGIAAAGLSLLFAELKEMPIGNMLLMPIALAGMGVGLGLLAVAAYFAWPGLLLASWALGTFAAVLAIMQPVMEMGGLQSLAEGLIALAGASGGLSEVSAAVLGMGVGLGLLAVAAYFAWPGLLLASWALGTFAAVLAIMQPIMAMGGLTSLAEGLTALAGTAGGLSEVSAAVLGIGAGLGLMAMAGLAALPIIGALMGLALVAPMLGTLGGLFGGGGDDSAKDDGMKAVADKLDQLIAVVSQGGVINMDGKKVGDVIGLSVSNARIA